MGLGNLCPQTGLASNKVLFGVGPPCSSASRLVLGMLQQIQAPLRGTDIIPICVLLPGHDFGELEAAREV